jgi:hypothetical protein
VGTQTQAEREFRVKSGPLLIHIALGLFALLFFASALVIPGLAIGKLMYLYYNLGIKSRELTNWFLLGGIGLGLCMLWSCPLIWLLLMNLRERLPLFGVAISVADAGIRISKQNTDHFIDTSDLMHILRFPDSFMLVWSYHGGPVTLTMKDDLLGSRAFEEICGLFSGLEGYTEDRKEIKQIVRKLRLNDLLRANHYEHQLAKIAKKNEATIKTLGR